MILALECDYDRRDELRERMDSDDQDDQLCDNELEELRDLDEEADGNDCLEDAERRIDDDPMSIQVRSDWGDPGGELEATEYMILLSTGGPATRIIGGLDQYGQPDSADLQAQDWYTPWESCNDADGDVLLQYASRFYFGE
jgi:hypothetical protein